MSQHTSTSVNPTTGISYRASGVNSAPTGHTGPTMDTRTNTPSTPHSWASVYGRQNYQSGGEYQHRASQHQTYQGRESQAQQVAGQANHFQPSSSQGYGR